uniref:G-patch domain-containing protein n=1 Tax=Spongospora subterranea TaxID=70186 RepID=A0A0H5RRJ6_9EUKA|eukprot:CRZ11329.1 hypothetical protein [Spongospora subterranea]
MSSSDDDDFINRKFVKKTRGPEFGTQTAKVPINFVSVGANHSETASSATNGRNDKNGNGVARAAVKPEFEKYTKGFGSKYLEKFGFKDRLGKTGTGIAAPIQAKQRPVGMGLGFDNVDTKLEPKQKATKKPPSVKPYSRQEWRRDRPAQQVVYKTVQEMLEERRDGKIPGAATVMDMTSARGAKLKTLGQHYDVDEDEDELASVPLPSLLPELEHNLKLIVQLSESELGKLERRRLMNDHEIDALITRQNIVQSKITSGAAEIGRLEKVQAIVTTFASKMQGSGSSRLSLNDAADVFESLQHRFQQEYREFSLEGLVSSLIFPVMNESIAAVDILSSYGDLPALFQRWRLLLPTPIYDNICDRLILPKLRSSLVSFDVVDDGHELAPAIDAWTPALFTSSLNTVYDTVIIPQLLRFAEKCNPLKAPTHIWAHPWLPVLGEERLHSVHESIIKRFMRSLVAWTPDDSKALDALMPWRTIFRSRDLNRILTGSIIPKLRQSLSDQLLQMGSPVVDMPAVHWCLSWQPLIGESAILDIFEISFWPRILKSIQSWISKLPDYAAIISWYRSWKGQFSDNFMCLPRVRQIFRSILVLMYDATTGKDPVSTLHRFLQKIDSDRLLRLQNSSTPATSIGEDTFARPAATFATDDDNTILSLRDLVSRYAEMNDLEFVPNVKFGRYHGKQIFKFGTANIYLDNNCIHYTPKGRMNLDEWHAIGLAELVEIAKT